MSGNDPRRQYERFDIEIPVVIAVGGTSVTGRTQNLSLGGMLITVDEPVAFGASVVVKLTLKSAGELELPATVRWTSPSGGVGVQFGLLRAKATWALNQLFKEQRNA